MSQNTLGYNLAALKYINRQHETKKVAEFYESEDVGMASEERVREKIEEGKKKRKRAALRS